MNEDLFPRCPEKDCTSRCMSSQHAHQLINAVTKGTTQQALLYLSRCHNAAVVRDTYGRTVLHVAASCGCSPLIIELLTDGTDINIQDLESGWTALHRSAFYGHMTIARHLIALGADLLSRDKEGLTPLDIIVKDRLPHVEFLHSGLNEVFTWGINANSQLGHENVQRKFHNPELVSFFSKQGISLKQVVLSKYHSVFLSAHGHVYTCGHGLGGRLGHDDDQTCVVPKHIEAISKETCIHVSAARDHSVFLMESGTVFSCGLNAYHQLGQVPVLEKCLTPKPINARNLRGCAIVGVCARRFHTAVWSREAVFTFGLNAGQLGHIKGDRLISQPRQISMLVHKDATVHQLAASDATTAVLTSRGDVFVLHQYQCRKVISKLQDIVQLCVSGGHLDESCGVEAINSGGGTTVTLLLLASNGRVYVWREKENVVRRCQWVVPGRPLMVKQVCLGANGIGLVTSDGLVFTGNLPQCKASSSHSVVASTVHGNSFDVRLAELVRRDDMISVSLNRTPLVHRALSITVDCTGTNFAVLQSHPNANLTSIPNVRDSEMRQNMENLMQTSHCNDRIHDIVLRIITGCKTCGERMKLKIIMPAVILSSEVSPHSTWAFKTQQVYEVIAKISAKCTVGREQIPAHRYILAARSEYFCNKLADDLMTRSIADSSVEADRFFVVPVDISASSIQAFYRLLTFIYTDTCDLLTVGCRVAAACLQDTNADVRVTSNKTELPATGKFKKHHKKGHGVKSSQKENAAAKNGDDNSSPLFEDPVVALKTLARQFGVSSLAKRLEMVQCRDGIICLLPGLSLPKPRVKFDQHLLTRFHDVVIKADDGSSVSGHKCILSARLEYFRGLFSSAWIETSVDHREVTTLKLPTSGQILNIVLDFLYTDHMNLVTSADNLELLCNILAIADQLLIGRLKDLCEVSIVQHLNLRNVCDILDFADMCSCAQLKASCIQFIIINLSALLETRLLDKLSDALMDEVSEIYKDSISGMNRRVITPYSGFPDMKTLEEIEKIYSGSHASVEIVTSPAAVTGPETTPQSSNKRTKSRRKRTQSQTTPAMPLSELTEEFPSELTSSRQHAHLGSSVPEAVFSFDFLSPTSTSPVSSPHSNSRIGRHGTDRMDCAKTTAIDSANSGQSHACVSRKLLSDGFRWNHADELLPDGLSSQTTPKLRNIFVEQSLSEAASEEARMLELSSTKENVPKCKPSSRQSVDVTVKRSLSDSTSMQPCQTSSDRSDVLASSPGSNAWGNIGRVVRSFKELMLSEEVNAVNERSFVKLSGGTSTNQSVSSQNSTAAIKSNLSQSTADTVVRWGLATSPPVSHVQTTAAVSIRSTSSDAKSTTTAKVTNFVPVASCWKAIPAVTATTVAASPAVIDSFWKVGSTSMAADVLASSPPTASFADILQDELQQRESLYQTTNKSLALIQLEEKAISELRDFYQAVDNPDEFITVQRVSQDAVCARPLWVTTPLLHHHKH